MTYEIRLRGPLPPGWDAGTSGATCHEVGAETVLLTPALDQEALHELTGRLRDLGVELLELRRPVAVAAARRARTEHP